MPRKNRPNGPTVFVRKHSPRSGYWTRERYEQTLKECRNEDEVRRDIPRKVSAGFLRQVGEGKGKDDRDLCREQFKKIPDEAIREAMYQPQPDTEHLRPTDVEE